MRKLLCICILLSSISRINCQSDAQYSHNMFNHMTINPGFAGSLDMVGINLLNRNHMLGFGNSIAPRYSVFSVNMPFTLLEKDHGAGLTVINDQNPVINDIGLKLSYAYRMKMKIGDGRLGIGGSFGFINSTFDVSKIKFDQEEPLLGQVVGDTKKPTIFDLGLGLFYKTEKLYMGISATHLVNGEYKVNEKTLVDFPKSSYYVTAGYIIPMNNPMFELHPSFFIQSDGASTVVNLNTNLMYNNRIWGGLSYRVGTAVTALFGIELLAGVKVGVAYDYETTALSKTSNGNLEVMVIYNFKLKKEKIPQKYKSIRFL